jgi:two-component system nitrate/nitrite response regulator NarL
MRILLCDDHSLLAESLAVRLRARGHEVRVESTPEGAVEAAAADAPDLCLMDLRFPGRPRGGLDAVPELRRRAASTALILLSGAINPDIARTAVAAGAHGVASKDISLPALESTVAHIAAGRVVASPDVAPPAGRELLTPREREIVDLIAAGRSTTQIAVLLDISVNTVRGHVESAMTKLGVHSRVDAASVAGLLSPAEPDRTETRA